MKPNLRTLLKARRQTLKKIDPKHRDWARHKVKVLERVKQLREELRV